MAKPVAAHSDIAAAAPSEATTRSISYTVAANVAPLWDEAAQACAAEFVEWLGREAAVRGLPITSVNVYRWQSFEDPRDQDLVIEVRVQGGNEEVQNLWTDAANYLGALIDRHPSPATEILTAAFRWL